MENMDNNFWFK